MVSIHFSLRSCFKTRRFALWYCHCLFDYMEYLYGLSKLSYQDKQPWDYVVSKYFPRFSSGLLGGLMLEGSNITLTHGNGNTVNVTVSRKLYLKTNYTIRTCLVFRISSHVYQFLETV